MKPELVNVLYFLDGVLALLIVGIMLARSMPIVRKRRYEIEIPRGGFENAIKRQEAIDRNANQWSVGLFALAFICALLSWIIMASVLVLVIFVLVAQARLAEYSVLGSVGYWRPLQTRAPRSDG